MCSKPFIEVMLVDADVSLEMEIVPVNRSIALICYWILCCFPTF